MTLTSFDPIIMIFSPFALAILHLLLDKAFVYQRYKTPRYIHFVVPLGLMGTLVGAIFIYQDLLRSNSVNTYEIMLDSHLGNSFEINLINGLLVILVLFISTIVAFYSLEYMNEDENVGLYYFLLLILISGMIAVLISADFLTLYVAYEIVGISSYFLVAFRKHSKESIEASVKYLFMGATGSITALLGITYIYGVAGSLRFTEVSRSFKTWLTSDAFGIEDQLFLLLIVAFIIAGFGVKASIVPFHSWLIDAHPAAPSGISAMLSGLVIKIGLYAMMITIVMTNLLSNNAVLITLQLLALLTMTLPNILAFNQTDLKRLLAYSSIYNMGMILLAFSLGTFFGIVAALFHLISHALMKSLAFMGSGYYLHHENTRELNSLRGIGNVFKSSSFMFSVGIFSLMGFPLTIGFMSKLWIVLATISYEKPLVLAGLPATTFGVILALFVLLNAVLAIGYYGRIIRVMWMERSEGQVRESNLPAFRLPLADYWMVIPMVVMGLVILIMGIYPYYLLQTLQKAALYWL